MFKRHNQMQCTVLEIRYDFQNAVGNVFMADGNCVDMQGTIDVFTAMDPEVQMIQTWQVIGTRAFHDTGYRRSGDEWQIIMPPHSIEDQKEAARKLGSAQRGTETGTTFIQ